MRLQYTRTKQKFVTKDTGQAWTVSMETAPPGCNFDVILFLDIDPPTRTSGWMLELVIEPGNRVAGQITLRPGRDPLATFDCSQSQLRIAANGAPLAIHTIGEEEPL